MSDELCLEFIVSGILCYTLIVDSKWHTCYIHALIVISVSVLYTRADMSSVLCYILDIILSGVLCYILRFIVSGVCAIT